VLIAAGALGLAGEAHAQAKGKEAPLELKADAAARPWVRYSGWPKRDEAKWNTLDHLASPPAPK
jgi:sulfur-oxidizing protein SoxA